jgi:hypothetical protein
MKLTKNLILMPLFFLALVSAAVAADTCTTGTITAEDTAAGRYELLLTCAADATPGFAVTLTAADMIKMDRMFVHLVSSYGNTVTAVGASGAEVEIRDSISRVILDNAGGGNNLLVNSPIATYAHTEGPGTDQAWYASKTYPWTINVENITQAGAFNLLLTLVNTPLAY